jgi:hypothetical protein
VIETTNAHCYVTPVSLGAFLNVETGPNKITGGHFFFSEVCQIYIYEYSIHTSGIEAK